MLVVAEDQRAREMVCIPSPSTCLTLASTHLKSAAKKNGLDPLSPVF